MAMIDKEANIITKLMEIRGSDTGTNDINKSLNEDLAEHIGFIAKDTSFGKLPERNSMMYGNVI